MKLTAERMEENPWIPITPTFKQLLFISLPHREAFYGGAAGGGKSEALLAAAALYADVAGYVAMLFRRTFADLSLKGALMDRAAEWWEGNGPRWDAKHQRWEFPEGGTIGFGYLDGPNDHLRYKSMEAQFIGMDEATDLRPEHILYMNTRLRRKAEARVPTRMRYAGNPGGIAHQHFGDRFVHPKDAVPVRPFIPATLDENPHADREDYAQTLSAYETTDVVYRQLRHGEWIADDKTTFFKPEWWQRPHNRFDNSQPRVSRLALQRFAALDTANKKGENNAFTALVVGEINRQWRLDIRYTARERLSFDELPDWVEEQLAPWAYDGKLKEVFIEEAASGIQLIQVTEASGPDWLRPLVVPVQPMREGKEPLWRAAALWCRRDCVRLPWPGVDNGNPQQLDYEAELYNVPNTARKDFADAHSILVTNVEDREESPLSTGWRYREAQRVATGTEVSQVGLAR